MKKILKMTLILSILLTLASCRETPRGVYVSDLGDTYTFTKDSLIVQAAGSGCGLGDYKITYLPSHAIIEGIEEGDKNVRKRIWLEKQRGGEWLMREQGHRIHLHPIDRRIKRH